MREILVIQIGASGINAGVKFWEAIADEHGLNPSGTFCGSTAVERDRLPVYFQEIEENKFKPRAVLVDADPAGISENISGPYAELFSEDQMISGEKSSGNWAAGILNSSISMAALNLIRKMVEGCDNLQGFQMCQSLGGGTGSAVSGIAAAVIKNFFPKKILSSFSILPPIKKGSQMVADVYNSTLSLNRLITECDFNCCLEYETLEKICVDPLKIDFPSFDDVNHLVSSIMVGATSGIRFPGEQTSNLNKMFTNLVPFPRLNLLVPSIAPLTARSVNVLQLLSVPYIVEQLFDPACLMVQAKHGQFLAGSTFFRGQVSVKDVINNYINFKQKTSPFLYWISNNSKYEISDIPPRGMTMSGTFLGNTTGMHKTLTKMCKQVDLMFKSEKLLQSFLDAGLETSAIPEASAQLKDIASEYLECQTFMIPTTPAATTSEGAESSLSSLDD